MNQSELIDQLISEDDNITIKDYLETRAEINAIMNLIEPVCKQKPVPQQSKGE